MVKTRKRGSAEVIVEKSPLLKFIDKVISLWKIYVVIFVVAVTAGGAFVVWYYIDLSIQKNAAKDLAVAQSELEEAAKKEMEDNPDNIDEVMLINLTIEKYQVVVDKHKRSSAAKLARFRIATAHYHLEEYDKSLDNYEGLAKEKSIIGVLSEMGIADCYIAKEDKDKAIEHFENARKLCNDKEFPYVPATIALADLYHDSGDLEKAEEYYSEVGDYHLYSPYAEDAEKGLREIKMERDLAVKKK